MNIEITLHCFRHLFFEFRLQNKQTHTRVDTIVAISTSYENK